MTPGWHDSWLAAMQQYTSTHQCTPVHQCTACTGTSTRTRVLTLVLVLVKVLVLASVEIVKRMKTRNDEQLRTFTGRFTGQVLRE